MSYEGYYTVYCSNGHQLTVNDCNESFDESKPCWCGSTVFFYDHVNQTNGDCLEPGCTTCGCHELVPRDPIAYSTQPTCQFCQSTGRAGTKDREACTCVDPTTCKDCCNTHWKLVKVPAAQTCRHCHGTGHAIAEVYDISKLVAKVVKAYNEG